MDIIAAFGRSLAYTYVICGGTTSIVLAASILSEFCESRTLESSFKLRFMNLVRCELLMQEMKALVRGGPAICINGRTCYFILQLSFCHYSNALLCSCNGHK